MRFLTRLREVRVMFKTIELCCARYLDNFRHTTSFRDKRLYNLILLRCGQRTGTDYDLARSSITANEVGTRDLPRLHLEVDPESPSPRWLL
ncbi:hypothetical protein V1477_020379 [Vespula maculifrons]|uniref:Uncharacterized protein n=1 Tax=Vespula maculifrons TaxID=7453 RepID=A0ABD2ALR8_VESMC